MFEFDLINISLSVVGLITLSWALIIYLSDTTNRTNFWFFIFIGTVMLWIITMILYRGVESVEYKIFWARMLYFAASTIPPALIGFSYIFTTEDFTFTKTHKIIISVPFFIISLISVIPNLLIRDVIIIANQEPIIIFTDFLHWLYAIYMFTFFSWVYLILGKKFLKSHGLKRTQILFVMVGILLANIGGVTANLVLPLLGNFTFNWLGQITVLIMVAGIFYAILKHKLFDAKVVATEMFVFGLWIFILIRIFLSGDIQQQIPDIILLIATIIIGILLIKSVIKEVRTREQLAIANKKLERLNMEKSEFLSFASHEVKHPLTNIKNALSLILEGSFGELSEKLKNILQRVYDEAENSIIIIDNYLNISRIEQGRMNYDFGPVDIKKLVINVFDALKHKADEKGNKLKLNVPDEESINITADYGKIKEVLTNVIDNSIKYTNPGGFTSVTLLKDDADKKVIIKVKDNGIGMSRATINKLFKRFSRAQDVAKQAKETSGTGLGMYISKEIVLAHGGRIWAESPGEGKGSTFTIELPFEPPKKEVIHDEDESEAENKS